jgi:hypothetical protein
MDVGGMEWIGLPSDSQGFVRRECPHCFREFKTRGGPADGATVQRYLGRHLPFHNHHEILGDDVTFHCVYCGRPARSDDWCTSRQRAWLAKVATALQEEIRFERLAFAYRTIRENPSPSFLPIPPARALPESHSEPDDMRRAAFFCCAEDVKVESHWRQPVFCPRCGAEHSHGRAKQLRLSVEPVEV